MIDIRVPSKDLNKYNKLVARAAANGRVVSITPDTNVVIPTIMISTMGNDKTFKEWAKGEQVVSSFILHGYNRIQKKCPHRWFGILKCKCEKCQLYIIRNMTGDCAHNWNAIMAIEKR